MRNILMPLSFFLFVCGKYASAADRFSTCYAKSDEHDCIQAQAQLDVNFTRRSFVLIEHINSIKCWASDLPRNKTGKIVETRSFNGRPGCAFVTTDNENIGSIQADMWTATYTGIIDGFYFFRCGID